ncbi:hypothetical protein RDV89_10430 [Nocardioides zeae]|uniref:Uncharacterized protein n=1 Tax=Nocardioides imazamoxiresistens TaxID=3231893 RepID=A0ABU3PW78_9ACTN|nr:hypothetical protein [Nocardioides zeae]MDT9593483.1 hypothetical protein [Nocardioides zeae]
MRAPAVVAVAVVAALVAVLATLGVQRWTAEEPDRPSDRLAGLVDDGYAASLFMEQAPDGLPDDLAERMELVLTEDSWTDAQARDVSAALVDAGAASAGGLDEEGAAVAGAVVAAAPDEVHPGLRAAVLNVLAQRLPAVHRSLTGVEMGADTGSGAGLELAEEDLVATLRAAGQDRGAAVSFVETYGDWAAGLLAVELDGVSEIPDAIRQRPDLGRGPGRALVEVLEGCQDCGSLETTVRGTVGLAYDQAVLQAYVAAGDQRFPTLVAPSGDAVLLDLPLTAEQAAEYADFRETTPATSVLRNEFERAR